MSMKKMLEKEEERKDAIKRAWNLNRCLYKYSIVAGCDPSKYYKKCKKIERQIRKLEDSLESLTSEMNEDVTIITYKETGKYELVKSV